MSRVLRVQPNKHIESGLIAKNNPFKHLQAGNVLANLFI